MHVESQKKRRNKIKITISFSNIVYQFHYRKNIIKKAALKINKHFKKATVAPKMVTTEKAFLKIVSSV